MTRTTTFLLSITLLNSCAIDVTNNIVLKETYNGSKNKMAVLFLKENGATNDNSLQVSLHSVGQKLGKEEAGNIFTVDSDHNATSQDSNAINLHWLSNDTLQIEYDKRLRVFTEESKLENTIVVYKEK